MNPYEKIIAEQSSNFIQEIDFELLAKYKQLIKDNNYFDFILKSDNGGFFFMHSLHIYGYTKENDFNNIDYVNSIIKEEYRNIVEGLICFGQDIFGNQFGFDIHKSKIVFFNVETCEKEFFASSFEEWINVLCDKVDYLTGVNVATT